MKKLLFAFFFISISTFSFSQRDSALAAPKYFLCGYLHFGMQQQNFNSLHQIPYLLNQPPNTSVQEEVGVFLGNRTKFFGSVYMGMSDIFIFTLNKQITGNYNEYTVKASSEFFHYGSSLYYNAFSTNGKTKMVIFPNVGIQFASTSIFSKANGRGIQNADTTFMFEQSRAKSILVNFGVMIELRKICKRNMIVSGLCPVSISAGYTLQIQNPTWTYVTQNNGSRNANQGGFYITVGYDMWLSRHTFKH